MSSPPPPALVLPDVLVLGSGGVLGEAWSHGVLSGIEQATGLDFRRCETFVGTSAGALVACALVAGRRPRLPAGTRRRRAAPATGPAAARPVRPPPERSRRPSAGLSEDPLVHGLVRVAGDLVRRRVGELAPTALRVGEPGGAIARAALLWALPDTGRSLAPARRALARANLSWVGRLRVVCVERRSGRRVVFGAPGAPAASVLEAALASCSMPWWYPPLTIGGREYVDGGLWSSTNIDVAPAARGTEVLCLHPSGSLSVTLDSPWTMLRSLGRAAAVTEALALRSLGARVRRITPDRASARAMGADLMDATRRAPVLEAGYAQGLAEALPTAPG
jgi:NTE family protein